MIFVLSSLAVLAGGVLITATLGHRRVVLWVLTVALLWYLYIVVAARLLSLLDLLGTRTAWLAADLLFFAVAVIVWRRAGSPSALPSIPPGAVSDMLGAPWLRPATIRLAVVVTAIYAVLLVATLAIPQSLDDVLTAYMARIGYWIENGNLSQFPTSTYNSVQVSYPANPQLPILRSIVLSGGSRFVGLEQWAASLLGAVGVFGLSRALGAKRVAAYLCGGSWLLIPAVAHEAGIALTDLVTVWLILSTLLFGYLGWIEHCWSLLVLSSVALGLALGTKQTLLFLAPGLAVLCLAILVLDRRRWSDWVTWMALSIPIILLVGSVDYIRNWGYFGHPLGEPDSFELFAVDATPGKRLAAVSANLKRSFVNAFFGDLNPGIADHMRGVWRLREIDPAIGLGWYLERGQPWMGFFVASTVLVGTLLALTQLVRRRHWCLFIPLLPAMSFTVLILWTRINYSGAFSRYLLVPAALLLVMAAVGLSALRVRSGVMRAFGGFTAVVVVVGMTLQVGYTLANSGVRPLLGHGNAWSKQSIELIELSPGYSNLAEIGASLRYFETCFGDVSRLGIMVPSKFPQAALFGQDFRRTVVQFSAPFPTDLDAQFFETHRIPVMFIETALLPSMVLDQEQLRLVLFGSLGLVSLVDPVRSAC